jgi:hypothetical protein
VAGALDVEHGRPGDVALGIGRVDLHHAFAQALILGERDRNAAGELVTLRDGVLLHELGELVDESRTHGGHALEIRAVHPHGEAVGRENAVAGDDRGLGVEFASKC